MSRPRHITAVSTSLRPMGLPQPLEVRVDERGHPVTVTRATHRGAPRTARHVEAIEDVWRVAEAWWREAPQARTYFRVILEGGRPLTLFHDDEQQAWFEQQYSGGSR